MAVSYVTSWSTILPSSSACSLVSLDVARRRSAGSRLFSLELTSTEASVMRTCIQQEWVLSVEHAHALYNQTLPWSTESGLRVARALYNHTLLCQLALKWDFLAKEQHTEFPCRMQEDSYRAEERWETTLNYLKPVMWHFAHTGNRQVKQQHSSFSPHFLRLLETYTQNSNTVHLVLIFWDHSQAKKVWVLDPQLWGH